MTEALRSFFLVWSSLLKCKTSRKGEGGETRSGREEGGSYFLSPSVKSMPRLCKFSTIWLLDMLAFVNWPAIELSLMTITRSAEGMNWT